MKMKRNPISNAVYKALLTGFVASSALGTAALAQQDTDDDQSVEEQGKITVTGSRIKRSDVEGALPVTVITREQLELSGESNAADYIRNLTFNSSGSYRPQSGNAAQGESNVSLRGLGSSRTLVLVDGRRLPKSPTTGSSQNLSVIPMGAIERIEVLTDGASAVYGSDAIGGVINIITRTDFQGAEIMLGGYEVSIPNKGGEREEGSILFGTSSDTTNVLAGVSWNDREIVFGRDYPWVSQGASVYGNSFTTFNPVSIDDLNWTTLACDFPGTGFFTVPNSNSLTGERCAYDFNLTAANDASTENKSFYARAKHQVNDNWSVWANTTFTQAESFGRYAPVPDSNSPYADGSGVLMPADSPNNPTNPNSPIYDPNLGLSPQGIWWWHRFDALGNRDTTHKTQMLDMEIGTTGQIGVAEVEFGVRTTDNRTDDIGKNYLLRSVADALIADGSYLLYDPYSTPQDVLNQMKITIFRNTKYDQDEYFGSVAFDMFELADGPGQFFIGAEYREEKYLDQYDPQSESGMVGGSAGNSAGGNRDVTSVFFETLLPVYDGFEISLAGRYDDYSDFGDNFSPKASFRWQPIDNLTLRASYGQGFRAPTLDVLTQKTSFSAAFLRDERTCVNQGQPADCEVQVTAYIQSNPDLMPEESDQYTFGFAYEPLDWMNFTLDYWNIEIDNRIKYFGVPTIVSAQENGDPLPAGLGCERAPNGSVSVCYAGYGNEGFIESSGIDFNMRVNYDLFGGTMSSNLQVSHLLDQSVDGGRDLVESPGTPANRAVLQNLFGYGDWSFAYNINYIGSQDEDAVSEAVGSWTTHDVQLNYHTPWNGKITLGANNVGEKYPPIGQGFLDGQDYDYNLYNGFGRVTYLRYTQTF
ncbi:outer membrane protein [Marinicella pacifica]|uniref:Outer membrane protein n=1 Tax=Marinicella pacifica TaxID=1171543 RepID=A0A917FN87_9GAMM|nr:TonB-dependent receptor [Marinicella pacifica]GGF92490.1 outer membrane protein [Marinicella pacifica]